MKQLRIIVSGDVVGVGYRSWFRSRATALGVSGWVRNREDGAVEAYLSGEDGAVDALVVAAKDGPMTAGVTDVVMYDVPVDGQVADGFRVVY